MKNTIQLDTHYTRSINLERDANSSDSLRADITISPAHYKRWTKLPKPSTNNLYLEHGHWSVLMVQANLCLLLF